MHILVYDAQPQCLHSTATPKPNSGSPVYPCSCCLVCCGCSSGVFSLVLVCYELCALSIRNHVWLAQDGVGCELGSVSHAITLRDTVLHTNNPHTQPNKLTTRRATTSHQEHKTDTPREHAHTTSQPANAMQQRHRAPSEHTCTVRMYAHAPHATWAQDKKQGMLV